ncbi:GNAT family N-acetyltransferase [Bizionia argentinensis JUB59]|uniref:GNAT family N-acetyltransferase n=1 Tax=Bizionia argentinensis JUB59 TaxID=1046627 RepID=G2EEC1_9FLAO|nr:GNAT family N-acetyltransferase [Bizionia argentinensis]EGV43142.1 GNAT family N-acetyltransferase [Bizionia argentinensis JUB59]
MIETNLFTSSHNLPATWDALVSHDIFLQTPYLKAFEKSAPNNITLYYFAFYKQEELIGVAIIQRVKLYLNDMFRNQEDSCFQERFKNRISKILKGNILVVGNLTHTGQHGVYFNQNIVSNDQFISGLIDAVNVLKRDIKTVYNKRIRAVLLKDYFLTDAIHRSTNSLYKLGFHQLVVQPNMIMNIPETWSTFDFYIGDFHKKYRDRYKSARKKCKDIVTKELDEVEIFKQSKSLYNLYKNVSNHAKINTFLLPENHFYTLKKQLGDNFKVFGYYLNDELVGFYTLILNYKQVETYFLGYNSHYQFKHQLYLNMLYDMAKFGINNKYKSVVYARTAMEIKSSVGAKPQAMVLYLKHTNLFMNTALKYIFKLMNPSKTWTERNPFKLN